MKLAPEVMLELVSIFQDALLNGKDASQQLRELDLVEVVSLDGEPAKLQLSAEYELKYPRASVWPDQEPEEV